MTNKKKMNNLSQQDLFRWLDAITNQPKSSAGLLHWVETKLKAFFPFTKLFMAYGELTAGQIRATHWLESGHDSKYLQQLATTFELDRRGSMLWWFTNRQPFVIDPFCPPSFVSSFELEEISAFGLKNVAAHGVLNGRSNAGTFFSFADVPGPLSQWHLEALRLLAPVLNDLFLSHIALQAAGEPPKLHALTPRQKEIVRLVVSGQDDKSAARQLGVAEKTVRNQLTEIYAQLGIAKRTQLMAMLR